LVKGRAARVWGGGGEFDALIALGKRLDQRVELEEFGTVRALLASSLLTIRDKEGRLRPLLLNAAQREFERRCGRKNIVLKVHVRWMVGNGNEGKMQQLEERMEKHEASLQRLGGIGAAFGVALTMIHIALDYLKTVHR
jgi:hypothetical protein